MSVNKQMSGKQKNYLTANIILSGRKLKALRQDDPHTEAFSILLEILKMP